MIQGRLPFRQASRKPGLVQAPGSSEVEVAVLGRRLPVDVARHPRARRYVLRLTKAGRLRLTVPRGASIAGGLRFAALQQRWIEREWKRFETQASAWADGTLVWYRGERIPIVVTRTSVVVGDQRVALSEGSPVRTAVERHLRAVAADELPARANRLAAERRLASVKVRVGNQRSRWGSCSSRGSVALNWRLIQMPRGVADYIVLHELAHRRHPNHSRRFWREVESLCPWWRDGERWLRKFGRELI